MAGTVGDPISREALHPAWKPLGDWFGLAGSGGHNITVFVLRIPTSTRTAGYVLVHVLSGTIHAQAWRAGLGDYHAGRTWVQPAIAYDIAAVNASETEPARAFVVVVVP